MSFNPNVPAASDARASSQVQIKGNFQAINSTFSDNHLGFDSDFAGMHSVLTMQINADPTTSSTQVALYNKLDTGSNPELFYRPSSSATPIQMTYPSVGITTPPSGTYYSYVAGPFVIYMGSVFKPTQGQTITLTPTTTLVYAGVSVSEYTPNIFPAATNLTGSSFKINYLTTLSPSVNFRVNFIAIGKP